MNPPPCPLPPMPTLSDAEWRVLPRAEKDRLRALKHQHRAWREKFAQPQSTQPQKIESGTPFRTIDGKPLELNIGNGGSCFVVLGGPSLSTLDLSLLRRRGVFSIAVNNTAAYTRANSFAFVDPPEKFASAIWQDPAMMKFVPLRFKDRSLRVRKPDGSFGIMPWYENGKQRIAKVADMPGIFWIDRNANFNPETWLSEPSINWGNSKKSAAKNRIHGCLNSMFCVLKLAWSLGFRSIFLVGCDFKMEIARPYAFGESKDAGGVAANNNSYRQLSEMLALLKPFFDGAGFSIFNCNPNSGLKLFPHIGFRDAIDAATANVEQDPINLANWYERN